MCLQIHVYDGFELGGIVEVNFTAVDGVLVSKELDFAGVDGDITEHDGSVGSAAQAYVGVGLDVSCQRGLHFQTARTQDVDIELEPAQILVGRRGQGDGFGGGCEQGTDVGPGIEA